MISTKFWDFSSGGDENKKKIEKDTMFTHICKMHAENCEGELIIRCVALRTAQHVAHMIPNLLLLC